MSVRSTFPSSQATKDTEMVLYHVTDPEAAGLIERDGFRDGEGSYLTQEPWEGVWLSDRPRVSQVKEPAVFVLDVPDGLVGEYEWVEEGSGYREFLIPAEVVNGYGSRRLLDWSDTDST
jgi:hypothetical protein